MAAAAAGLTFSVANPGGVNVAGMLALRGSDPSITIAPGHPYLTWRPNARYAVPTGALAGQALSLSTISAGVGGAIGVGPAAGAAQALLVLINPPGPAVLDRVCQRLVAEGFPMVAYETDGALCTACGRRLQQNGANRCPPAGRRMHGLMVAKHAAAAGLRQHSPMTGLD